MSSAISNFKARQLPRVAICPGLIFLRGAIDKMLPGRHLVHVAEIWLPIRLSHRKNGVQIIVFRAVQHAEAFSEHSAHSRFSGIGRAVDKVAVSQIVSKNIVFDDRDYPKFCVNLQCGVE